MTSGHVCAGRPVPYEVVARRLDQGPSQHLSLVLYLPTRRQDDAEQLARRAMERSGASVLSVRPIFGFR